MVTTKATVRPSEPSKIHVQNLREADTFHKRETEQTRDTHRRTNKLATATVTVKCLSLWIDQQKQVQLVGFCKPASGLTRNLVFEPKHRPQVLTLCWAKPKIHTET